MTDVFKLIEANGLTLHGDIEHFAELVRADEREECAKVCENIYEGDEACGDWPSPEQCAAAIRARGETAPTKEIDPNQWAFDNGLEST